MRWWDRANEKCLKMDGPKMSTILALNGFMEEKYDKHLQLEGNVT